MLISSVPPEAFIANTSGALSTLGGQVVGEPPPRRTQVEEALTAVVQSLDMLSNQLQALHDRLAPVLVMRPMPADTDKGDGKNLCNLAGNLDELNRRVGGMALYTANMLDCLEL